MSTHKHIPCSACKAINRVPTEKLDSQPVCGKCKEELLTGAVIELGQSNFARFIQKCDLPVIVDFWAPWCGPCKMMAPNFVQLASSMGTKAIFVKVNTEQEQNLAGQYNIRSIPTLAVFKSGKEITRQAGALDVNSLQSWVQSIL